MPTDVAWTIRWLVRESLPILSLVAREHKPPSEDRVAVLMGASAVGYSMSCMGIKDRKNLSIVGAGADILYAVLRYAVLNELKPFRKQIEQDFRILFDVARKCANTDAEEWLRFIHDDAIALTPDKVRYSRSSRPDS